MYKSRIIGVGKGLPERVVTNFDLEKIMDTSDAWIQERTGIIERRFAERGKDSTSSLGATAALMALDRAGVDKNDVDFIVFATLSPDYYFPGAGVMLQREMGITKTEIGAIDIRNQCSGFVYALSVADQFIKTGMYKTVLVVGAEVQTMGIDFSTEGRGVGVIFGDGAGAVVLQRSEEENMGILNTHMHSDGTHAEELAMINPGSHGGYHHEDEDQFGYGDQDYGGFFVTEKMVVDGGIYPFMNGTFVFKHAVTRFPEVIREAFETAGENIEDMKLLIPHQANLRITQFVGKRMRLRDEQVYSNIQRYGNTTAASIPIAMCEAWEEGRIKEGDLVCLAAFGSGFTWASALIRW